MSVPKTVKKTARTWTVQVAGRTLKVTRRRASGKKHWNRGEARMVSSNWVHDCPELGIEGQRRLTVEAAIWELAGVKVGDLKESREEWKL